MPDPAPMTMTILAREFLFRRHPLQFRLLQQPVFDVEGFLLRQRNVLVNRLRAAHDLDGAVVKFRRYARFAFVLAPGNHAQAGNQNDGRIRIAHGRRVGMLAALVIIRVILPVLFQSGGKLLFQAQPNLPSADSSPRKAA